MDPVTQEEADDILRHKRLRDEFAMAVLPAVFSDAPDSASSKDIAARAYSMADAMIAERDR